MRFLTLYKWTPKTARAAAQRWITMFDGTAPQAVMDAIKKVKVIDIEFSAASQFISEVYEIADADFTSVAPAMIYLQEVFEVETHVVQSAEEWSKSWDMLELLDKVPKPEWK